MHCLPSFPFPFCGFGDGQAGPSSFPPHFSFAIGLGNASQDWPIESTLKPIWFSKCWQGRGFKARATHGTRCRKGSLAVYCDLPQESATQRLSVNSFLCSMGVPSFTHPPRPLEIPFWRRGVCERGEGGCKAPAAGGFTICTPL